MIQLLLAVITLSVPHIILEEFWPTLLYNITPGNIEVYVQLLPQHFSQDEVWTMTGLLKHFDFFLSLFCRFAAVLDIMVLLHDPILTQL